MSSVEQIVELFLAEMRSGGRPEVEEFCRRHPDLADELRDLLPTIQVFEQATGSTWPADTLPKREIPAQIDQYDILREVGVGGMGVVYEARHRVLGRRVALKVLTATLAVNQVHRERFQREIRLASNLHHTNIVPVYETGTHAGIPYFTMQFIEGESLEQWCSEANVTIDSDRFLRAAEMVQQVAEALHYAHGHGVLHRDIKPSNLLLDSNGAVWITDFGLARREADGVTRTGDVVGTLRYMAPERFSAAGDARSDVYSLGLTLYELCTLRPAFDQTDSVRLYRDVLETAPPRPRSLLPAIPRDLETIILKAIDKDPGQRYATAGELADDLRLWLDERPIRSRRVPAWEQGWRWARRNPLVASLGATVALMLFVLIGVLGYSAHRSGRDVERLNQANREARQHLYESYVGRAQASRYSGRPGQNHQAVEAVTQAARLLDELQPDRETREVQRWMLRNEAIAAMVLTDISELKRWEHPSEHRLAVAFDEALDRCAKADSQGNIVVRAVADDSELARIPGEGEPCWELRSSPDGRYLIGVFHRGPPQPTPAVLRVWDLMEKRELMRVEDLPRPVIFDWHPPTHTLAIADARRNVVRMDFRNGEVIHQFDSATRPIALCCLDSERLAIARDGVLEVEVRHWEPSSDSQVMSVDDEITSLAWSASTQCLAAGSALTGEIYLWNLARPELDVVRLRGHTGRATRLYFTHHGRILASNSWDSTVRLWDVVGAREVMKISGVAAANPGFGRDDRGLAFSGPANQVGLWNVTYEGPLRNLPGGTSESQEWAIAFHPSDDRWLAVATAEGLRFWDCQRGEIAQIIDTGLVRSVDFSSDGQFVYAAGERGITRCTIDWTSSGSEMRLEVPSVEIIYPEPVYRAHLSGNNARLVAFVRWDFAARVIDTSSGETLAIMGEHPYLDRAAISPDGRWVVTATWSGVGLRVWDADTGELVRELLSSVGSATVAFSPSGKWLAATDGQRQHVWSVGDWQLVHRLSRDEPDGWPGPLTFSADDTILVLPRNRTTAQLVDVVTGRSLAILEAPQRVSLSAYAMSPSGRYLAINHTDGIQLWDLHHLRQRLAAIGLDW